MLTLANAAANLVVGGSGAETLGGAAATGSNMIYAGSGPQLLIGGAGTSVLVAGTGTDTLVGGSGLTLFTFQNGRGGGFEFVTGWDATHDLINLSGYGASPTSGLSSIAASGGDSLVTLTDGTRILFVNTPSLSAANFV